MKTRILAVTILIIFALATIVYGADSSENRSDSISVYVDCDLPANEELFAAYVDAVMLGEEQSAVFGTLARARLNAGEQGIYDILRAAIEKIADGELATAEAVVTGNDLDNWGIQKTYVASNINKASELFSEQYNIDNVISALITDCPYDFYWYDKTVGASCSFSGYTTGTKITLSKITFNFTVSEDYRESVSALYDVDLAKTSATVTAYANAVAIVEANANLDDYNKLSAYDEKIRELVEYNHDAADDSNNTPYGDPWQLIWVFDNDPSTKVVCEGYSKAFQLLCDLSDFENDITCVSVAGSAFGGGHMWNIVQMEDGKNYLVDVTNTENFSGGLFLRGATGSVDGGYYIAPEYGSTYATFAYYTWLIDMFGDGEDSILALSTSDYEYTPTVTRGIIDSGKCGDNLTWTLYDDGELVIEGTGAMYVYSANYDSKKGKFVTTAPWGEYSDAMTKLTLTDSVTSIGDYAFYNRSGFTGIVVDENNTVYHSRGNCLVKTESNELILGCQNSVIPEYIVTIGNYAFCNCIGFTGKLEIPNSVTTIGKYAFSNCRGFTGNLVIPDSVTTIDYGAFSNCSGFTGNLVIPDSVTTIGGEAFEECSGFTGDLVIPDSVTSIGIYAFAYCSGFTGIVVDENNTVYHSRGNCLVKTESNELILGCQNSVIPEYIVTIGKYAFYGCSGFTGDLVIPDSVTTIGGDAFKSCNGLKKVYFEGNAPSVYAASHSYSSFNTDVTLYYLPTTTGWTDSEYYDADAKTWKGYKIRAWVDGYTLSGTVTSFNSATDVVTIELFADGATEAAYSTTVTGNSAEYTFETVEPGTYTMTISKSKHATREYTVVVETADLEKDVEIWMYGDVYPGDKRLSMVDATQIQRYLSGKSSIFGSTDDAELEAYRLKVADVYTGDGRISMVDVTQIQRYLSGKSSIYDSIQ